MIPENTKEVIRTSKIFEKEPTELPNIQEIMATVIQSRKEGMGENFPRINSKITA